MMSQVGQFHLSTSCDVFATSHVRQFHLGNSWYVAMTSQIGQFYLGSSETSWKRPKKVRLINVSVANVVMTSQCGPRHPNLNEAKMIRRCDVACRVGMPRHWSPGDLPRLLRIWGSAFQFLLSGVFHLALLPAFSKLPLSW